jgi:hypothetical protein
MKKILDTLQGPITLKLNNTELGYSKLPQRVLKPNSHIVGAGSAQLVMKEILNTLKGIPALELNPRKASLSEYSGPRIPGLN